MTKMSYGLAFSTRRVYIEKSDVLKSAVIGDNTMVLLKNGKLFNLEGEHGFNYSTKHVYDMPKENKTEHR